MDQLYQRKINTFNQTRPSNVPHDLSNSFVELTGLGSPHTVINESRRARSLVVSDLRPETKDSRLESSCQLCAEVTSPQ